MLRLPTVAAANLARIADYTAWQCLLQFFGGSPTTKVLQSCMQLTKGIMDGLAAVLAEYQTLSVGC